MEDLVHRQQILQRNWVSIEGSGSFFFFSKQIPCNGIFHSHSVSSPFFTKQMDSIKKKIAGSLNSILSA